MTRKRLLGREWAALGVGASSILLTVLDVGLLSLALPAIEDEFTGSSRAVIGFAATAYLVTLASLLILGGRVADRRGRRWAFHRGLAVTALAAVLTGVAPTAEALVGARALQGAGAALLTPTALAMVLPDIPIERRALAVGVWGAVGAAAALFGPVLGGLFVDLVGWRWVFGAIAPLALLAYLAGGNVLRESVDPAAPVRLDPIGVGLGVVAVGTVTLAILQGNTWGWVSWPILVAAAVTVVAAASFQRNLARSDAPIVDRALLTDAGFWAPTLSAVFSQLAFFAFFFSGPVLLTKVWGFSASRAGLAIAPAMALSIVTQGPFGAWCDRRGFRAMLVAGGLVPLVGIVWWSTARRVGSALGVAIAIGLTGGETPADILDGLVVVWLVVAGVYAASSLVIVIWYPTAVRRC